MTTRCGGRCSTEGPVQTGLDVFDWIFLPKVRALSRKTGAFEDVVRGRLLVIMVVFLLAGTIFFLVNSSGQTLTSWILRGIVFACYFIILFVLRLTDNPQKPAWAMSILLLLNSWVQMPFGAGSVTLTSSTLQFYPIILAMFGGLPLGLLGSLSALLNTIVAWQIEATGAYVFPATIRDDALPTYMGGRAIYLTLLATVVAILYTSLQNARLHQLRELNTELHAAVKEAREAAELKTTFIATMSHEIRTPLNGIIGMAQVLGHSKLDESQRAELQMLQNCGESLLLIVNDILDIAKITANKVELEQTSLKVHEIVQRSFSMVSIRANTGRVQLVHDLVSLENAPEYLGDPTRIQQVLVNILTNAIKFTPSAGEVSLSMSSAVERGQAGDETVRHRVTFAISDTGMGIPADRLEAIFEPFTQNDASTTRQHGGTGLGLTICRSLVRLMGGDVRVESRFGYGSTFTFDIVLDVLPKSTPARTPSMRPLTYNVLVIDSCKTHSTVLMHYLKELGCQPTLALDAVEAQAAVARKRGAFEWFVINMNTYNTVHDQATWNFVTVTKAEERRQRTAKPVRILLMRNQWAEAGGIEFGAQLRELRDTEHMVSLNKPAYLSQVRDALTGVATPLQAHPAPDTRNFIESPPPRYASPAVAVAPPRRGLAAASLSQTGPSRGFDLELVEEEGNPKSPPTLKNIDGSSYSESSLEFTDDEKGSDSEDMPAGPSLRRVGPARSPHTAARPPLHTNGAVPIANGNSGGGSGALNAGPATAHNSGASTSGLGGTVTSMMISAASMSTYNPDLMTTAGISSGMHRSSSADGHGAGLMQHRRGSDAQQPNGLLEVPSGDGAPSKPVGSPERASAAAAAQSGPVMPTRDELRCLLVEDNPTNVQVVLRLLKVLGYTCDVANNGQEAVDNIEEKLAASPRPPLYNIILMDLHMPKLGGAAAAERIRNMLKDCGLPRNLIYIVAVSADALQTTKDDCLDTVFDGFLAKPFLLPRLKETLAAGIHRPPPG